MDFAAIAARAFRDNRSTALTLGVGTVVVTHAMMILMPDTEATPPANKQAHAITNLVAAGAIVWGARLV